MKKIKIHHIISIFTVIITLSSSHQVVSHSINFTNQRIIINFPQKLIFNISDPIIISSDNDFINLGFPGTGTLVDPYRIESFNISSSTSNLIEIRNTRVYFQIRNNYLSSNFEGFDGIFLLNVTFGVISNNIISNNTRHGIYLQDSENILIYNNSISYNNWNGIWLANSKNITISKNEVNNNLSGLKCDNNAKNNLIVNNSIYNNNWVGIELDLNSFQNNITNNKIQNNSWTGIYLANTNKNLLYNNSILNNGENGIRIDNSANNNVIRSNEISHNLLNGIWIGNSQNGYNLNNSIRNNVIKNNKMMGVWFDQGTKKNHIIWNDFIGNNEQAFNGQTSQAYDAGENNSFQENYWNEWIIPENDSISIFDRSYLINGTAYNMDLYPLENMTNPINHRMSYFQIMLIENITVFGSIIINWTKPLDSFDHTLSYSFGYIPSQSSEPIIVGSFLTTTYYKWDTLTIDNGYYKILVNATDQEGTFKITSIIVNVNNIEPIIPPPKAVDLLNPLNGSILETNNINLTWIGNINASLYHIQVSTDYFFIQNEINTTTNINSIQINQTTNWYYWHVRVVDLYDVISPWSSTWNFTIDIKPITLTLLTPKNESIINSFPVILNWTTLSDAAQYEIEISYDSEFSIIKINDSLKTPPYTIQSSESLNESLYYWRVRVKNRVGSSGNWSAVWSFFVSTKTDSSTRTKEITASTITSFKEIIISELDTWPIGVLITGGAVIIGGSVITGRFIIQKAIRKTDPKRKEEDLLKYIEKVKKIRLEGDE